MGKGIESHCRQARLQIKLQKMFDSEPIVAGTDPGPVPKVAETFPGSDK